ncbi:WD repeat-containing protein 60 isoform X2 [Sphaeramia orbicularis]|uniref:WD repeat-containing protein 60 isoform X2 n=1 Tax=Sphaeramia orbicularis TaxID=375764 RepID=UPI00117D29B1|nr:WD repeat-containing protein 60 isoform X2 [Sphaeramia orbicularis]
MHSDKKLTKEDTWRPADLRRYIREEERGDFRKRDESERKHHRGDSIEKRTRDQEKEYRREKDNIRERTDENVKDRYSERRKEGSRDRREERDKDREKRRERDRQGDVNKYVDDYRENKDRRRDREERHDRERDKERSRDKEKERVRDREKYYEEEKGRRREERDKERSRDKEKERVREKEKYYDEEKDRRREERDKERSRDKEKERAREREKYYDEEKDRRREERDKERSRDKERERAREREKYYEEEKDRRREERDKEKSRDKEKERVREKEKYYEEEKDRRREERDKERRREERDREHRNERERRRNEPSGEEGRDRIEKYERNQRDRHQERERHKDEYEVKRSEKERRERPADRTHSELNEERDYREERRKDKDERERRHKDRRNYDDKQKPDSDSREHQDLRKSSEEVLDHRSDRERTERDKYKDRRYQEERDPERNDRDKAKTKKSASETSHSHKTTIETEDVVMVSGHQAPSLKYVGDTEAPITSDQDAAEPEYEDDFEDYEEDFEEMDESANDSEEERQLSEEKEELSDKRREEIKAIQRAMDEENERMGTAQSRQSPIREEEDRPKWSRGSEKNQSKTSQRGKFINFVAAKQREINKKVATQQKKRSTELLRLIDLDFSVTSSLLDLPPVNEYDMYIRNFGTANTKQAYVQCNEDNADRDIQTEEIELCEKWTQHPPEHYGACGDPNLTQDPQNRTVNEINFDSKRLTAFLLSASQVMVVLLEEDQAERESLRKLQSQTDTLSFSDGSLQLNTKLPFLYGRSISLIHFSQVQRHTMMSVHKPTTKPSAVRLDSCTVICIWNIWEPSKPQKILVYESEVLCCCFSPGKAILVFAGTSVGSVVLWDLREQACNHYRITIGEDEWTLRQPSFSTDAVMAGSGHLSSVTSVEVVPSAIAGGLRPEVPLLASEEESTGLSFQLASLDESGVLNFWVVVELPKANESGSQTDLGLRPGGKVKLLHSSSLLTTERVSQREATKTGPLQTLQLKFLPSDSNHFFIGTNMGIVSHGTSHGLRALPKFYRFHEGGVRPVDVNSISFSPFRQHLFLVGCGDGSIRLHVVSYEQPLTEWNNLTAGEPVVSVQWAQTRSTVFCVLDAASNFHIWDLLKNETEPVVTERINADRVTAMATFGDSGQQNTYSGVALAHESGKIEIQYFTKNLTVPSPAEDEKLECLMKEAF